MLIGFQMVYLPILIEFSVKYFGVIMPNTNDHPTIAIFRATDKST